jgi:hypothetical protein
MTFLQWDYCTVHIDLPAVVEQRSLRLCAPASVSLPETWGCLGPLLCIARVLAPKMRRDHDINAIRHADLQLSGFFLGTGLDL